MVGHRERAVERVVERKVGLVVPGERAVSVEVARRDTGRIRAARVRVREVEAVVPPVIEVDVLGRPPVRGVERAELRGVVKHRRVEDDAAVRVRQARGIARVGRGRARRLDRVEDADACLVIGETRQVRVERAVLLHDDDDVLDGVRGADDRVGPERGRGGRASAVGAGRPVGDRRIGRGVDDHASIGAGVRGAILRAVRGSVGRCVDSVVARGVGRGVGDVAYLGDRGWLTPHARAEREQEQYDGAPHARSTFSPVPYAQATSTKQERSRYLIRVSFR